MRRSPIQRSNKRIARRSKKTAEVYRTQRIPLVRKMLEGGPACELGPRIKAAVKAYDDCQERATCLHELKKRSQGGSIIDMANILRSCVPCNGWVEDNPNLAHRAGLVIKSWE